MSTVYHPHFKKEQLTNAHHLMHPEWQVICESMQDYGHILICRCPHCEMVHIVVVSMCFSTQMTIDPKQYESLQELATQLSQSVMYWASKNVAEEKAGQHGYEPTIH